MGLCVLEVCISFSVCVTHTYTQFLAHIHSDNIIVKFQNQRLNIMFVGFKVILYELVGIKCLILRV